MKVLFFSSDEYTKMFFTDANQNCGYEINFLGIRLNYDSVELAKGYAVISCSVYDEISAPVIDKLKTIGVQLIALRTAGYNNVDIQAAKAAGITVAYVPNYSPRAVAEHAIALILALNRNTHKAYLRMKEGNFSIHGLLGFDLYGKSVGVIGTGKIGSTFAQIMHGFGCKLLAYDLKPNELCLKLNIPYVTLEHLFSEADIISLHCPLTPDTHHIINETALNLMRDKVMLINTSRGALIDTRAVINALKAEKIGYLGLDVYEEEQNLFYSDLSDRIIKDDTFVRLQTFPNVLITSHQGFLTKEAYTDIANLTLQNIEIFEKGQTDKLNKIS